MNKESKIGNDDQGRLSYDNRRYNPVRLAKQPHRYRLQLHTLNTELRYLELEVGIIQIRRSKRKIAA